MVVITDESTAADIAEAIGHVNHLAKRSPHVLGTIDYPTDWDRTHELLDAMLDDWRSRTTR